MHWLRCAYRHYACTGRKLNKLPKGEAAEYVWVADLVRLTVFTALVDNAELWEWIIRTGAVPACEGPVCRCRTAPGPPRTTNGRIFTKATMPRRRPGQLTLRPLGERAAPAQQGAIPEAL